MLISRFGKFFVGLAVSMPWFGSTADAQIVDLTVRIENLSPTNSISFAPTRVAFHNGSFDPFNIGQTAGAAIVSIAEGGSGADWFPAVAAADPSSVAGSIVNGGPAVPLGNAGPLSNVATQTFRLDTSLHSFFTFANMVVPSNDLFLGNDSPLRIFDANGNLTVSVINQTAAQIWDANSEVADPANAAFLVGGVNAQRIEEGGLVAFDLSELAAYEGLTTAAGYAFNSTSLNANTPIFRITLSSAAAIPEPSSALAIGVASLVLLSVRRGRPRRAVLAA